MSTTAAATTALAVAQHACRPRRSTSRCVSLSRNFGKEAALLAGLDHARLGAVLFMDGDGQHPPALIPTLVGHWLDDGYDVVFTAKAHRANEPWLRRFGVRTVLSADQLGRAAAQSPRTPATSGCCRRAPPTRCGGCRERNRFFKGLASWIGFRQFRVDYEPAERAHGRTSWNFVRADRAVDRRADLVLGGAAAAREPARLPARRCAR